MGTVKRCGRYYSNWEGTQIDDLVKYNLMTVCEAADEYDRRKLAGQGPVEPTPEPDVSTIDHFIAETDAFTAWLAGKRYDLMMQVSAALADPLKTVALIIASAAAIVLAIYVARVASVAAVIVKVMQFVNTIGTVVKTIASILQVDTIIMLMQLGYVFVDAFHLELAKVYKSLSALSEECAMGASFIAVFIESGRAIIHAGNTLSRGTWFKAEAEYADALSAWLSGVQGKLKDYVMYPEHIFVDVQRSIASYSTTEGEEKLVGLWAAIGVAGTVADDAAASIITMFDDLDKVKKNMPQEMQDAIAGWYTPFRTDYEKFLDEKYYPFKSDYDAAKGIIEANIRAHGINLSAIESKIKTPYDFFAMIFGLPLQEQIDERQRTRDILFDMLNDMSFKSDSVSNAYKAVGDKRIAEAAEVPPEIISEPIIFEPVMIPPYETMDGNTTWYRGDY